MALYGYNENLFIASDQHIKYLLTRNRKLRVEEVKLNPTERYNIIDETYGGERGEAVCDAPNGKFVTQKASRLSSFAVCSSSRGRPHTTENVNLYIFQNTTSFWLNIHP